MSNPPLMEYPKVLKPPLPTDLPSITCRGRYRTGDQHHRPEAFCFMCNLTVWCDVLRDLHLTGFFWDALFTPHPYVDLPCLVERSSNCKVCTQWKKSVNANTQHQTHRSAWKEATHSSFTSSNQTCGNKAGKKWVKNSQTKNRIKLQFSLSQFV